MLTWGGVGSLSRNIADNAPLPISDQMGSLVSGRFASMVISYGGGARLTAHGLELGAGKIRSGVGRLMWYATAGCSVSTRTVHREADGVDRQMVIML
jgi:hypothetical protein